MAGAGQEPLDEIGAARPPGAWKVDFDDWLFELRPAAELAVDLATRVVYRPASGPPGVLSWIGLDYVEELTFGDGRSIGTLLLQPFFLLADGLPMTPLLFDEPQDWEVQWRYVSLDVTRWEHRGLSWLTGHFELPFGLERQVDTNGTLRQYSNARNLGLKADWGTGLHSEHAGVDYHVSLTRGSGNDYRSADGSYAFCLRIGNSLTENLSYGASFMDAHLTGQDAPGDLQAFPTPDRTRFGIDCRWRRPSFAVLGEASFGSNGDEDVWSALFEVNRTSDDESVLTYAQIVGYGFGEAEGWQDYQSLRLGARHTLGASATIGVEWSRDIVAPAAAGEGDALAIQWRYRF
ncbi:MAG: hypothetical protein CMJ84_06610 [Planctomycetes bacterium]|nr:hypothetical protein [Planctomycetota bacterium]MDP6410048.1 hypothetical protein [Planctomycetota bacterium]